MTIAVIKENIEQTKFRKWQENTRQMVKQMTAKSLNRMEELQCLILVQQD